MLRVNGDRAEKLPVNVKDGASISFTLDTAAIDSGPTTFFELVEE